MMDEKKIKELIAHLDSSSYGMRLAASQRLESAGDIAVPFLIEALEHESWMVRQDCADVLGRIEAIEAYSALEKLLDDPEAGVRKCAREAIEKIQAKMP